MNVQPICRPLAAVETQWLVFGLFDDSIEPPEAIKGTALGDLVGSLLDAKELSGGVGDTTLLPGAHPPASAGVLVVGLGAREKFGEGPAFTAGVAAAKRLAGKA